MYGGYFSLPSVHGQFNLLVETTPGRGFFAYATYDLTNLATLKDWPAVVSVVDLAWGTCVTAVAATGGYAITQQFS